MCLNSSECTLKDKNCPGTPHSAAVTTKHQGWGWICRRQQGLFYLWCFLCFWISSASKDPAKAHVLMSSFLCQHPAFQLHNAHVLFVLPEIKTSNCPWLLSDQIHSALPYPRAYSAVQQAKLWHSAFVGGQRGRCSLHSLQGDLVMAWSRITHVIKVYVSVLRKGEFQWLGSPSFLQIPVFQAQYLNEKAKNTSQTH